MKTSSVTTRTFRRIHSEIETLRKALPGSDGLEKRLIENAILLQLRRLADGQN